MTPDQYKSVLSDTTPRLKGTNNTMTMEQLYQKGNHKCHHEEDWKEFKRVKKEFREFKDRVLVFIGAKEATNGALKDKDNSLDGRLTRIENKVDKLLFAMLAGMGTAIVALVVALISIIK